jgi:hypothetical protein
VWYHVAFTYDQSAMKLYCNGQPVATNIIGAHAIATSPSELRISGADYHGYFDGLIDEPSVYNRALSAGEIAAIYSAGSAGKCRSAECAPSPPGLIGWWPGEGNANDIIGTNNGTLSGGVTFAKGEVGQAFNFNPANGTLIVPDSPSLRLANQLTTEAWINARTLNTSPGYAIVSKLAFATGNNGYQFILVGNTIQGLFNSPGQSWPSEVIASGPIISTGIWYHVAFTYDQSAMKLYCNGQPVATNVIGAHAIATSISALRISGTDTHAYFDGLIDEPSVYNRALSASEIAAIYDAGSAGKCGLPPSILNQPQSQAAVEGSSATFAVTAAGMPPLSYQWQFEDTVIAGATASSLTLTNLQVGQAGSYLVVVTNMFGSATSSNAVLTLVGQPLCAPSPAGLISWWPGQGNANDIAGANNGILSGGVTFTNGEVGQAFSFDPANGTVIAPDSPSLRLTSQLTIEAWINARTLNTSPGYAIVSKLAFASGNNGYQLILVGDTIQGLFNSPGQSWPSEGIASGPIISTGIWYHVAFTYDQSAMKLYCNGQPVATNVIGAYAIATSISALRISGADTHAYFDGLIDEPSIYNRALSASEIAAIYDAGSAGKCGLPPSILNQPQSQAAVEGSSATFAVVAAGMPPLSYQWQFEDTVIAGATASSLTLTNLRAGQAGSYLVVVTNVFGSVTSSNAVLTLAGQPLCAPPPAGLISWWPGQGNANDIAGANNGILSGGVTFTNGEVGQAFSFDPANGTVIVPDSPNLRLTNQLTIEAWINTRSTNADRAIVSKVGGAGGNNGYQFALSANSLLGQFNSPGQFWPSSRIQCALPIAVGVWNHAAWTYDQSAMRLYWNGTPVATNMIGANVITASSSDLRISGDDNNHACFDGMIDEPSVYNRALSAGEIAAIYHAGSAGKCRPTPIPHAAIAAATTVNGFVVGVTITDGGLGYTNTPAVRISGGGGSGARTVAVVSNGVVIAVNILDAGTGYTNAPDIFIAPPFIPQPTMHIALMSLLSFTNLAVGTNYQFQFYSGSTWSNVGAAFTAASPTFTQYVSGTVGLSDYRLATTPVPEQAYATAQVFNGFVVGATVTSGGSGYGSNVVVSIVGGGGHGATATVTVSGGVVTGLTITDAGIGYTSTPAIVIAPPPATALLPNEVTQAMELDLGSLSPYENYQLEFASVIGGAWTNLGIPFTPTSTSYTQYVNVSGNSGYFRVRYVP